MAKPKTIYSLKGIFVNFLDDTGKERFLIPAYQRGYKWQSDDENSQVKTLMRDLFNAFGTNRERYYLQFITLKENGDQWEVIDGQQRLTTVTILFCVLKLYLKNVDEDIFVNEKLNYQIRENFVKKYIYENIKGIIDTESWDKFISGCPENNNQDIYYIFKATKTIYDFVKQNIGEDIINKYYDYMCENVQLIVNILDSDLDSEKIFINANKGVKLKDEDLIKGLLLTKIPLDIRTQNYRMSEIEVNEIRTNLGRQWDELSLWASKPDIRNFYKVDFSENNLEWLIYISFPGSKSGGINPLFSYVDDLYRIKKIPARDIFGTILETKSILNDWICDPEIYNLLGYTLHTNKSKGIQYLWKELYLLKTKNDIIRKLKNMVLEILPLNEEKNDLIELNYEETKSDLFNLFLILELNKCLPYSNTQVSYYNFNKISSENWSIEHIFPQNISDFKNIEVLSEEDLELIKEILPKDMNEIIIENEDKKDAVINLYSKIMNSDKECSIIKEEHEYLEYLLKNNSIELHKIGNLALLQQGINSSLSNHFFNGKRNIIVNKISSGNFVPYHTYDLFSKLIIPDTTSLNIWSKNDIDKHTEYIKIQIQQIVKYLKSDIIN